MDKSILLNEDRNVSESLSKVESKLEPIVLRVEILIGFVSMDQSGGGLLTKLSDVRNVNLSVLAFFNIRFDVVLAQEFQILVVLRINVVLNADLHHVVA